MAETGIFHPEERLELIAGQIIKMSAKGMVTERSRSTAHESAIIRTERLLRQRLGDKVLLRIQSPVQLDDYSEPEPDISVVKPNPLDYEDHHPNASEVFLVIEIADSSLKYDREIKAMAYSKSGIIEYWILDINGRKLYMYRLPSPDGYRSESIFAEDVTISPLAFGDCAIVIRELLVKI
ncbi:Putative restriction endonuclease domain-containing protein [Nostoc sp. DSM 114161]|jgi:Uma2 family endonuclease